MLKTSIVLACLLLAGCYTHTRYPGQVRVIEYGAQAEFVEVELNELGVSAADETLWLTAAASFDAEHCTPVRIEVRAGEHEASAQRLAHELTIESARTRVTLTDNLIPLEALAAAVAWPPVLIHVDGRSATLHDEHLYNLRAFVREMRCPDPGQIHEQED